MACAILTIFDSEKLVGRPYGNMGHILKSITWSFLDPNLTIISVPSNLEASFTLVEVIFARKKFLNR